jgi:hypothetical protein
MLPLFPVEVEDDGVFISFFFILRLPRREL